VVRTGTAVTAISALPPVTGASEQRQRQGWPRLIHPRLGPICNATRVHAREGFRLRLLWLLGWLLNRLPPWCAHWAPQAVLEAAYRQRLRDWLER